MGGEAKVAKGANKEEAQVKKKAEQKVDTAKRKAEVAKDKAEKETRQAEADVAQAKESASKRIEVARAKYAKRLNTVEMQNQQKFDGANAAQKSKLLLAASNANGRIAKVEEEYEKKFQAFKKADNATNERQVKATLKLQREAEQDNIESALQSKELKTKSKTISEKAVKARAKANQLSAKLTRTKDAKKQLSKQVQVASRVELAVTL